MHGEWKGSTVSICLEETKHVGRVHSAQYHTPAQLGRSSHSRFRDGTLPGQGNLCGLRLHTWHAAAIPHLRVT